MFQGGNQKKIDGLNKTNTWSSNIQSTLSYYLTYLSIRFRYKIAKYLQIMKTIVYMVIILDQVF